MNKFLKKYWWVLIALSPLLVLLFVYSLWFVAIFAIAFWEIVAQLCYTFGEWLVSVVQWFTYHLTNP